MKVVIDTNVLVSAILKDRDPEAVILCVVSQPNFVWIASQEIISEYHAVLSRKKFGLTDELKSRWFDLLNSVVEIIPVEKELTFPRDQKDAKFITCAICSGANFFITGDRDFSEAKKLLSTTILSVSQFKTLVCDKI